MTNPLGAAASRRYIIYVEYYHHYYRHSAGPMAVNNKLVNAVNPNYSNFGCFQEIFSSLQIKVL